MVASCRSRQLVQTVGTDLAAISELSEQVVTLHKLAGLGSTWHTNKHLFGRFRMVAKTDRRSVNSISRLNRYNANGVCITGRFACNCSVADEPIIPLPSTNIIRHSVTAV